MVDYRLIGSRMQEQRKKMKLTQDYVSEAIGITTVYLSKIENGKVRPTIDTLSAICDVIQCDLGTILTNVSSESDSYQTEEVTRLFRACSPEVKPIALLILEQLGKL